MEMIRNSVNLDEMCDGVGVYVRQKRGGRVYGGAADSLVFALSSNLYIYYLQII